MKSGEHAAVGGVVSVAAALVLYPDATPRTLALLVGAGVALSVFVDLDHFLIARAMAGDWRNLRRAVTNPRVGLIDQEEVFRDVDEGLDPRRLLSHHLLGGAATLGLAALARPTAAAFVAVVLYAHVVCDYLRDLGYA